MFIFSIPSKICTNKSICDAKDYALNNFNVPHDEIFVEFRLWLFSLWMEIMFVFFCSRLTSIYYVEDSFNLKICICLFSWRDAETPLYYSAVYLFGSIIFFYSFLDPCVVIVMLFNSWMNQIWCWTM